MSSEESKIQTTHQTSDQEETTQASASIEITSESPTSDHEENNATANRASTRARTHTEKGYEYQKDLLTRRLSSINTRIQRQCSLIDELMLTSNTELVHQELIKLEKLHSEAEELHSRLMGIIPNEEQLEQLSNHEMIDNMVFDIKRKSCQWLKEHERESQGSRSRSRASSNGRSRPSSHSNSRAGSARSKSSSQNRSHKSSRSKASKTSSKLDTLKVEEEALHQMQTAKQEELNCMMRLEAAKMQTQRIRLNQKIIKAQLEEDDSKEKAEITPEDNQQSVIEQQLPQGGNTQAQETFMKPDPSTDKLLIQSFSAPQQPPQAKQPSPPHKQLIATGQLASLHQHPQHPSPSHEVSLTHPKPIQEQLSIQQQPHLQFQGAPPQQQQLIQKQKPHLQQQLLQGASLIDQMIPMAGNPCQPKQYQLTQKQNIPLQQHAPQQKSATSTDYSPPQDEILYNPSPQKLSAMSQPFQPSEQMSQQNQFSQTTQDDSINMMEVMMKLINLHTAPDVDIDVFSGDPLEYEYFRATFKDAVEKTVADPRGRLTRLLKFTTGDAKDLIKHCIYEDTTQCFEKAMQLLDHEYGNKQLLINMYLKKLRQWPQIPKNDAAAYKKLHRFLLSGETYKRDGKLAELDSETVIRTCVLAKMDRAVQDKWLNKVVRARERGQPEQTFSDLVKFVEHMALLASDPSYSQAVYRNEGSSTQQQHPVHDDNQQQQSKKSYAVGFHHTNCLLCDELHPLESCHEFQEMKLDKRVDFLFYNRLCFNCFGDISPNHYGSTCKSKQICKQCKGDHHTLMHEFTPKTTQSWSIHSTSDETISMCIVPIRVCHENNEQTYLDMYALLDENCQGTFILESVANQLPVAKRPTCITTETINGLKTESSFAVDGLVVKPTTEFILEYGESRVKLPTAYTKETLTNHGEEVPTPEGIKEWAHLKPIIKNLPTLNPSIPLGMIIGANCPKVLEPQEVIPSTDGGPYASRSLLGWRVIGPIGGKSESKKCFRVGVKIPTIDATTNQPSTHHLALDAPVKDILVTQKLQQMYEHDFSEDNSEKRALSNEDKAFVKIMQDSATKVEGHYQLPLPFRNSNVTMANNRVQAQQRLTSIKRKMIRDQRYYNDYCAFMKTLLEKGYAVESHSSPPGKTWYLPHHGVRQPRKDKLRVVFDCSAKFRDSCLNDELLQGPDLTNLLVGVLLRFRHGNIGYMGDIEAMYYQVRVPPEQQTYLKFLWWPNGNLHQPPKDYKMRVHLFGAVSSPSCANYALRQTVTDTKSGDTIAGSTILNNFYVDDMLTSNDDIDTAVTTISAVQQVCSSGGFNLTKFTCKESQVMESIPVAKRSVELIKEISRTETIERALGVSWCLETDCFGFRISLQDSPLTRRGILSTISSIYDPLGIAGPFLLKGRKILQRITALTDGWDNQVPEELSARWRSWRNKLPCLQDISIRRCYKPPNFGTVMERSLHLFSDASEIGYGVAAYLRQVDIQKRTNVSLVFGKSRVSPIKSVTIPRLELTAATVSAKLGAMLKEELMLPDLQDFYWSDSKVSLGYISNDVKRFRVFVANRVQKIRAYTTKESWHYVESKENPADHASRGISVDDDVNVKHWFQGPQYLWDDEDKWKDSSLSISLPDNDPEIRKSFSIQTSASEPFYLISKLEERISSWKKITRVVATILEFLKRCQMKKKKRNTVALSVKDIQDAEKITIKLIQKKYMSKEIHFYRDIERNSSKTNKRHHKRQNHIWKLDPFIDEEDILSVGGRLKKSVLPSIEKHPAIIPKQSILSRRIAEHCHRQVKHLGRTSTLNEIRQSGYWIVSANTIVRSIIHHCLSCKLLRGKLGAQKMADLPVERFSTEGPFTFTGIDMFGPFYIKDGRKENKRFVALFTCLSSRAIHLESTIKIDTDSFIQAVRRFIARRGTVRQLFSDNGKNFIGAENEWKRAYKDMDHTKISEFLLSHSCDWIDWKKNPPKASHMGGVWERKIRSVRSVLSALFLEHSRTLNDESFRTLLTEAECIINSTPLTIESLSDPDSLPLSPINLLTLKTKVILPPPGVFQKEDVYCRKRWRHVQHLANEFWTRWKREFLSILQTRQKWVAVEPNFKVDDIVLIKDENLPRNQWPLGRIIKTFPGADDGLVRQVQLHVPTSKAKLLRPIHKLVLLVEANPEEQNKSKSIQIAN